MKLVISTEIWKTRNGKVVKAVVRKTDGKFVGATNQTGIVDRVQLVGRK
jgi:hypothetical protein